MGYTTRGNNEQPRKTNEQKLLDTDDSMAVGPEEGVGAVKGKGGRIHGGRRRCGFGWWAQVQWTEGVS